MTTPYGAPMAYGRPVPMPQAPAPRSGRMSSRAAAVTAIVLVLVDYVRLFADQALDVAVGEMAAIDLPLRLLAIGLRISAIVFTALACTRKPVNPLAYIAFGLLVGSFLF